LDEELAKYRQHLEELVRERTRELEEAHEQLIRKERLAALGQLTATVAHEIRNPLGTVKTSIFSIGDALERNELERVYRALKLAERNIQRCDGIINELLDYTRKWEVKLEPVAIDLWLNDLLDEQEIPENIECRRELHADLVLPIAREHLRRAVVNVFANAIQAMQDEETTENRLTIESAVTEDRLEIHIIDTGPGIVKNVLDKVFEPLFSTKGFGIGLGLPIVRDIMERHGGGIEIQSEIGKGTIVILWLPLESNKL
jgi:signal transduction histidine kinase